MVADHNGGHHRGCRYLGSLGDESREDQDEDDGAYKALRPLPHLAGLPNHFGSIDLEFFNLHVRRHEGLELFESYVRNAGGQKGASSMMVKPASPSPFD